MRRHRTIWDRATDLALRAAERAWSWWAGVPATSCDYPGCDRAEMALLEAGARYPRAFCAKHRGLAREWWTGCSGLNLVPPREITAVDASRIAADPRGGWLTCHRCRGLTGPVEVLGWRTSDPHHRARGWCSACWGDLLAGADLTGVLAVGVEPLDQPTAAVDLFFLWSCAVPACTVRC